MTLKIVRTVLTTCILASCATLPLAAQVVVNEVCASNLTDLTDNFGNTEDWFELYNAGAAAADISGWYVTNRAGNPLKWQIPAGTAIPAGGRQLFICSQRNEVSGGFIHTNFNLDQTDGDHVLLSDASGTPVDDFEFTFTTRTKTGHSRGRITDGAGTWSVMTTPTPGNANAGVATEYLEKPILNPAGGFYGGAQSVTITGPAGATIRYTTDGSEPTVTSTAYAGPIPVNATTVVRATCFGAAGNLPSFTESNSYFINSTHTVPVWSIAGDQVDELLNGNGGIEPFEH